jgi:GT2 family glycosyltransferase
MADSVADNLPSVSAVIVTYCRERVLVETVRLVAEQLLRGDELLVIDQTPRHEPDTEKALASLARAGTIRWYRRKKPHICEAMNSGACLARGEVLLFLDDDIVPLPGLVEAHRKALAALDAPPASCGQVLQPWNDRPVSDVRDYGLGFDAAYDRPCDLLTLMAGNFAIRRETFFLVGGLDENFFGPCYRLETELSHRIFRRLGRKVRFLPTAGIRHLKVGGGTRAFGEKDTWRHIGGSVGDYYFALRCLPPLACLSHCLGRLFRAPLNRNTIRRPWLIPSLYLREAVAWFWAVGRMLARPNNLVKGHATYELSEPVPAGSAEIWDWGA